MSLFVCGDDISCEDLERVLKMTYEHFHNPDLLTVAANGRADC